MRWGLFGLGLVIYAAWLITMMPATLVDAGLQRASGGRLRIAEAQGTLWAGAGQLELLDANRQSGIAKHFAWRFRPGSLLRGLIVYEVELDDATRHFPVTISLLRIEFAQADLTVPAVALGLGVPKLAPLGLTGDLRLQVKSLTLPLAGGGGVHGNATLQWRRAGSTLTPVSPLGDYELQLVGEGALIRATLRTLDGPLQLDGKGSWASAANPAFMATARIDPEHQQQLAPLLRLIALDRGNGNFELQLR